MKRTRSWRLRRASMMPLMPSPGSPKTVSTPQSMMPSTSTSAAVCAIAFTSLMTCHYLLGVGQGCAGHRDQSIAALNRVLAKAERGCGVPYFRLSPIAPSSSALSAGPSPEAGLDRAVSQLSGTSRPLPHPRDVRCFSLAHSTCPRSLRLPDSYQLKADPPFGALYKTP